MCQLTKARYLFFYFTNIKLNNKLNYLSQLFEDLKADQFPNEALNIKKPKAKHIRLFRKLVCLKEKKKIKDLKGI